MKMIVGAKFHLTWAILIFFEKIYPIRVYRKNKPRFSISFFFFLP